MRIATLGVSHEANTFSPVPASLAQFERAGIARGQDIVKEYATSQATVGGFLALADEAPDVEVVPLVFARITPMGTITADAFETLLAEMLAALADQGPWDAVLLALHGAAVSAEFPDADGELARRVREQVGPDVPVGTTLDMHANVSLLLVESTDVVTVYQTNPHVDPREQALRCAQLVRRAVLGEIRPTMALEMPPVAINILRQGTSDSPMRELLEVAQEQARRPGVLSVSAVEGFPYADVAEMGMSFLAVTDDDAALAREVATELARFAWDQREDYEATGWAVDDALRRADEAERGPVVLLDTGDNIGGGSPGDSTFILAAAQRLGVRRLFQSLCDPGAVEECVAAGVGSTVELEVGGKTDDQHGAPVRVRATVRVVTDGRFEDPTPTHGGFRFFDTGTSVLLATEDGHDLLLTSDPQGTVSLEQLRSVGLDPLQQPIIVAKGVNSPRAAFEPIASELLYVATPGSTSADLSSFTFEHRRRPMFPFEPDATYAPAAGRSPR